MKRRFALALWFICSAVVRADPPKSVSPSKPDDLLKEADRLAWLKNWTRAEPLFKAAEQAFRSRHDERDALYAQVSALRGALPRLSLVSASQQIGDYLALPLVENDARLKLRCLVVKGDIDLDFDDTLAEDDWEQAHIIANQLGEAEWVARANGELGIIAFLHGDSGKALQLVFGALKSADATHDVGAGIRYRTLLGRGMAEMGNYEQGLKMIEQAIALAEGNPDLRHPMMQWADRALVLERMGKVTEAQGQLQRAIAVAKQRDYAPYEAQLEVELAGMENRMTLVGKAVEMLKAARLVAKQHDYLRLQADADLELSKSYQRLNQPHLALSSNLEGVSIAREVGDRSRLPELLGQLARVETKLNQITAAEASFQDAEDIIEGLLLTVVTGNVKASLLGTLSDVYLGHFNLEAYQRKSPSKAYAVLEMIRGRSTSDALNVREAIPLNPERRRIERQIGTLQLQLMQTTSHPKRASLLDQLFSLEESLAPAQVEVQKPDKGPRAKPIHSLAALQRQLKPHEQIVEYVLDDPRSSALWITRFSTGLHPLTGKKTISPLVDSLTAALARGGASQRTELSALLLDPLPIPADTRTLVIVPDGALHRLPFEVLWSRGEMLLNRFTVSYAPSGSVFETLRANARATESHQLLAVSGALDDSPPLIALSSKPTTRGVYDIDFTTLPPLRAANDEVADVAKATGLQATVLSGPDATEQRVKQLDLGQFEVIHFAAHGVISSKYPDRSALVLRASDDRSEDGLLQAREIRRLRLNSQLVTLSACSTGVGKLSGEEGVANLVQAFLIAGANSVVANLWSVDDEFSREFMRGFYSELSQGRTIAEALRQTKINAIQEYRAKLSPNMWAGFVVYGDADRRIQ